MRWKRIQIVWLPVILFSLQIVATRGYEYVAKTFGYPANSPDTKRIQLWSIAILAAVYALNHFSTHSKFFKKYRNSESMTFRRLDEKTNEFLNGFKGGSDLSVNIMLIT